MKRRDFFTAGAAIAGGAALVGKTREAEAAQWDKSYSGGRLDVAPMRPGVAGRDYRPVVTTNGATLPHKIVDGVRVFNLVAEELKHEFFPGVSATVWGYNGRLNATTIEAVEGERIRIYVTNLLAVPTTVHWHGIFLPNGMDGISGVTQKPIQPGETFKYEFTLRQSGTFMYHSHHDTMTQEGMGLLGMLIVHPRNRKSDDLVDRDFVMLLAEYQLLAGTSRPNTLASTDFNILTINGKSFPSTEPLVIKTGERVRLRIGNLSAMDHHPIHLHGYRFKVTATDGERIPASAQFSETTVLVAVGQTRDVEFIADAPGDWLLHCHMTHHTMNQMGHDFPNMIGVNTKGLDKKISSQIPGYMSMGTSGMGEMGMMKMTVPDNSAPMEGVKAPFGHFGMGGMFTLVKVRDDIKGYDDPGWYKHPKGTVAEEASADELRRDGIAPPTRAPKPKEMPAGHDHGGKH